MLIFSWFSDAQVRANESIEYFVGEPPAESALVARFLGDRLCKLAQGLFAFYAIVSDRLPPLPNILPFSICLHTVHFALNFV